MITAIYRVRTALDDAPALARKIALEQTVEVSENLVTEDIGERIVGKVLDVAADENSGQHARLTIGYPNALANHQVSQLVNLVYGNVSMYPSVRLVDLDLPDTVVDGFDGPRFGVEGIRDLLGVHGRPLLATALKPRGSSIEKLAQMAGDFARGGGDIVKDDQNLVEDELGEFVERITACAQAVAQANEKTGRNCLYFPFVTGPFEQLEERFAAVANLDLRGVLVCPMLTGLDAARAFCKRHDLIFMAHPAMTGNFTNNAQHGIDHGVLMGTLFRIAGVDISIFPGFGGRISYSPEKCRRVMVRLRQPLGNLRTAMPCPAGGKTLAELPRLCQTFGADTLFLIGGALLGHSDDLVVSTEQFQQVIANGFDEYLTPPENVRPSGKQPMVSSCEVPSELVTQAQSLIAQTDFQWENRPASAYKTDDELAFKAVRRVELIGKADEPCQFDLRYFEIAPGGFTSFEKHHHIHVVIGARGEGVVRIDDNSHPLRPHDISYISPNQPHQLRNETRQPLGFYCIVDRQRDRPVEA